MSVMETALLELPKQSATGPYLKIVPPSGWAALRLRDVWRFRDLLLALASRDVKLRYKQTALGVIWVVLQPLIAAAVFAFVFIRIAQLPTDGVPSMLFMYVGLLGWNLFSGTVTKISTCLTGNSQLISKIFFPRLVLPLSAVPSVLIDFVVAGAMLILMMLMYRYPPHLGILLLPVWIAMLLLMSLGIGLITAALTVSYRDVQYILPVIIQILMYGSPIAYSVKTVFMHLKPKYQWIYMANPLSAVLEAFRSSLLGTPWPPQLPLALLYSGCLSVGMFLIGAYTFKRMERRFADVI